VTGAFGPDGVRTDGIPEDLDESKMYNLVIRGINTALGNRIFLTEKGHVGVGLNQLEAGDIVALLSGSAMPYIFRPIPNESGLAYNLIGWAYIMDYMNGGALQEPGFEFKDIIIH
jgi:hypothetical protein